MLKQDWHTSRHFLGLQATKIRWVPCASPSPPDLDGRSRADNLFVLGGWHQNSEKNYLWVANLSVELIGDGGAQVESAEAVVQAAWQHTGKVTDLAVADMGDGNVCILAASSNGSASLFRLNTPREPGAPVSSVQVVGGSGAEGPVLDPWLLSLHRGPVASVDISETTSEVLTAGRDGRIFVVPASRPRGGSALEPFHDSGGSASFSAARWCSGALGTFVTASTTGGLECWDTRQGPLASARRPPREWAAAAMLALEVHPSRPHLCATGGERGEAAVWDLRFSAKPIVHSPSETQRSDVWEVHFDASEPYSGAAIPPLMICNEAGAIRRLTPSSCGELVCEEVFSECCAVNSFDIEPSSGRDVIWVSEQECVGYMRRPTM